MKKLFRTILTLCSASAMVTALGTASASLHVNAEDNIPINKETFPDDNFRFWVKKNIAYYNDVLTPEEIQSTKRIVVSNQGIQSLKGIENFKSLTELNCNGNGLEELDVSQLTELKDLNCQWDNLEHLDVSKNIKLESLSCGYNRLKALDVSSNQELVSLYTSNNELLSLDLSKNTKIKYPDITNQRIDLPIEKIDGKYVLKIGDYDANFNSSNIAGFDDTYGKWDAASKTFTFNGVPSTDTPIRYYYNVHNMDQPNMHVTIRPVIPVESVQLDQKELTVYVNDRSQITAKALPETASNQELNWQAEDESIIDFGRYGYFTALKEGSTTVTVSSAENPELKATCHVTVLSSENPAETIPVTAISIYPSALTIHKGSTEDLGHHVSIAPWNATDQTLKWESRDNEIASVDQNGTVTGKNFGNTVITVSSNSNSEVNAAVNVTVGYDMYETSVYFDNFDRIMTLNDTQQFTVQIKPDDLPDKMLKWESSDESVLKVDQNGLVTAAGIGVAHITATVPNGQHAYAEIYVIPPFDDSKALHLKSGETKKLDGEVFTNLRKPDEECKYRSYESLDQTTAYILNNKKVKGVIQGRTIVLTYLYDEHAGRHYLQCRWIVVEPSSDSSSGGSSGSASAAEKRTESMFRLYNPNTGEHFYTSNEDEKTDLIGYGWKYEGVGWTAPKKSDKPVYRLYNSNGGEHHYTSNVTEKDKLLRAGWSYEGIGWYSADKKDGVPVYRQYNPNTFSNNHNYTASEKEKKALITAGWQDEGVAWYGSK